MRRPPARLLLAAIFALASLARLVAQFEDQPGWYRSDESGMAYEGSSAQEAPNLSWSLFVEASDIRRIQSLYQKGSLSKRTISEFSAGRKLARVSITEGGRLAEETLYSDDGRLSLERRFLAGGSVEERAYVYIGGRLISATLSRNGTLVSAAYYFYAPDGRLVSLKENAAPGGELLSVAGADGHGVNSSSWTGSGSLLELRTVNAEGRLVSIRGYEAGALTSEERFTWSGGTLLSSVMTEVTSGLRRERSYDVSGRVLEDSCSKGGSQVSVETFSYDGEGRVVLSRLGGGAGTPETVTSFEYGQDDGLSRTRVERDGVVQSITVWETSLDYVQEFYDAGVLFARVIYENGLRVGEEQIRDGKVIRQRSFP